jgi:cytochrome c-type biogenesis protein CcmH/NrfF
MGVTVGRLIEEGAVVTVVCHACRRRVRWRAEDLRERLLARRKLTFHEIAPRLRCTTCKSEWVAVSLTAISPATTG